MATTESTELLQIRPRIYGEKRNLINFPIKSSKNPGYSNVPQMLRSEAVSQLYPTNVSPLVETNYNLTTSDEEISFETRLCAPYPPCNPLGCGRDVAPIDCDGCDAIPVILNIIGMCLLAILIVFANVLVIVIIMRTETLRLRHGLIKVSLAVSDLLIGLFVIPSAAYNLATTMYFPSNIDSQLRATGRLWKPTPNQELIFVQKNTLPSIFFGTILIISLTSSIYNLLLLSIDRLFSVAKPLQSRSDKYFSKKRVKICIAIVWTFGVVISAIPACIPSRFSFQLDGTTLFYLQVSSYDVSEGVGPIALFGMFVIGLPYIAIVILNISTLVLTMRKLNFSRKINQNEKIMNKEQAKRMKLIMQTSPEMQSEETITERAKKWLSRSRFMNTASSNPSESTSSTAISQNSSVIRSADRMNTRVTKMIVSMVAAFTVCICPYLIVNAMLYNDFLNCSNLGVVYNVVLYLLLLNSAMNFFIYNFWHKEFRVQLIASLTRRNQPRSSRSPSTHNGIFTSSANRRFSIGKRFTFGRRPAPQYQMGNRGGVSSFQDPQPAANTGL